MLPCATSHLEGNIAMLRCPHCGSPVKSERTWAQAAVATLMAAPAIPQMATQVRCTACGRLSTASDLRIDAADKFTKPHLALWIVGLALLVWLAVWLFRS